MSRRVTLLGISRSMQRAMHHRRLLPYVFHDVDLAARRPSRTFEVVAQHPERRPHALSLGNLDPRFEFPVLLREQSLGPDACRRIVARYTVGAGVVFLERGNHEVPTLDLHILRSRGVVLQLMIAPSASAGLNSPLRRIGC